MLAEKNIARLKPASTFKVLTLLTLLSSGNHLTGFTLSPRMMMRWKVISGTCRRRCLRWRISYTAFFGVGNDAARAMIANYGGGQAVFAQQMNRQASFVNASDTSAVNPSGLDDPGQCTTVRDMAQFFRAGLKKSEVQRNFFPERVSSSLWGRNVDGKADETYLIVSQNRLLMHNFIRDSWRKTGFTDGRGELLSPQRKGTGALSSLRCSVSPPTREETATALFDWGFANRTPRQTGKLFLRCTGRRC